ncbi:uncharacterized [Tachysurus ichikawai]
MRTKVQEAGGSRLEAGEAGWLVMVDGAGAAVHSPVLPAGINVVEDQAGSSIAISFRPLPHVICHYVGYHNMPTFNFLLHFISGSEAGFGSRSENNAEETPILHHHCFTELLSSPEHKHSHTS